jgi:hypothetical protein
MGTSAREVPNKDTNQTHEPEGHISSREHISYTPCRSSNLFNQGYTVLIDTFKQVDWDGGRILH